MWSSWKTWGKTEEKSWICGSQGWKVLIILLVSFFFYLEWKSSWRHFNLWGRSTSTICQTNETFIEVWANCLVGNKVRYIVRFRREVDRCIAESLIRIDNDKRERMSVPLVSSFISIASFISLFYYIESWKITAWHVFLKKSFLLLKFFSNNIVLSQFLQILRNYHHFLLLQNVGKLRGFNQGKERKTNLVHFRFAHRKCADLRRCCEPAMM